MRVVLAILSIIAKRKEVVTRPRKMFSGNSGVRLGLMSFDQVCEKIVASLEMSRVGSKAVDPLARSFSMGRVSGLEEALRILQAEQVARVKGAAPLA